MTKYILFFLFMSMLGGVALLVALPEGAWASSHLGGVPTTVQLARTGDLPETIGKLINIFLGVLGTIAFVLILYGGYTWMMAAGSTEDVDKAKKILTEATVGLIIIAMAGILTSFVVNRLGTTLQSEGAGTTGAGGAGRPAGSG